MSVFSKNAIMTGSVDLFCLACEAQLRSDEDAVQHITKPIHKKNLDATGFLEKYKEDRVRKVKKGYFCEMCNLFMRTAAKVGPHVAEARHRESKTQQHFRREGNGVLAFDTVFIGESAWHGLIDDTCTVCDAEFDNAQIHKTDTWHALNLVLIEIEVGHDRNIYRKVDDSTFQCLTCNMVCALNSMTAHFEETEHKTLYQNCCEAAKAKINEKQETTESSKEDKQKKSPQKEAEKTVKEEKTKNTGAEPKVEEAEKTVKEEKTKKTGAEPKVDEKNPAKDPPKKQTPKNSPPPLLPRPEASKKPIESKEDISKKPEAQEKDQSSKAPKDLLGKTDKDICKGLGAVDYITRDVYGKQWCILCDWAMDDHAVEAHVKSRHHQTILKMHKERTEKNRANGAETKDENMQDSKTKTAQTVLDFPNEFGNDDIDFDANARTAFCRKCSKTMDYNYMMVTNHIKEHKKPAKEVKPDKEVKASEQKATPVPKNDPKPKEKESRASSVASTREEAEVEAFAKQHNLTYTKDNNNAFCRVCVTKVPASIKNMREHINGISHKNKVAKTTVKTVTKAPAMTPSHVFIDNVITIENMFSKDIVINEKFVVNILSFLMITKNGTKLRCQACEVNVAVSEIDAHKNTAKHERIMNDAMVASSEETEFIREIRPNLFHCGYCNQLEAPWATMEAHLRSTAHREAKTAASWRMMEYSPMIAQHKMRQRMEFTLFTRMLMGQLFGDD